MSIKEYIDQMLFDNILSNEDKINLLENWINKLTLKILNSFLHSSELIEIYSDIEYMQSKIKILKII